MKECPQCKVAYDETLSFCLQDGTPLTSADDSEATLVLPLRQTDSPLSSSLGKKYAALVEDNQLCFLPDIPADKLSAAYTSYAQSALLAGENPVCLYDDGGNGRHGCLITDQGLYYKNSFSQPGYLALRAIKSVAVKGVGPWKTLGINDSIDIGWTLGSRKGLESICLMLLESIRPLK